MGFNIYYASQIKACKNILAHRRDNRRAVHGYNAHSAVVLLRACSKSEAIGKQTLMVSVVEPLPLDFTRGYCLAATLPPLAGS